MISGRNVFAELHRTFFGSSRDYEMVLPSVDRHPYYIYAPAYTHSSAGIRVLHLLCHWLNRNGQTAFIAPLQARDHYINPELLTPLLTSAIYTYHQSHAKTPIVVYPEIIKGNPLNAACVVRYLLNIPGLLGGDTRYSSEESVWAFSHFLASQTDRCDGILHMPVIDERVFNIGRPRARRGTLFYASKFKGIHRQQVFGIPSDAIEITKGQNDSPTPTEIAEMMRGAEYVFCFENTAIATEAVLCGCPAVFVPNDFLKEAIASQELGWDGYAWGTNPREMNRAKKSVRRGIINYHSSVARYHGQLMKFISKTQKFASRSNPASLLLDNLYLANDQTCVRDI